MDAARPTRERGRGRSWIDLFGAETPLAVRFFIAFVVVFALIGVTAWLIRRFGAGALGGAARARTRSRGSR